MKTEAKALLLGLALGLMAWLLDSLAEHLLLGYNAARLSVSSLLACNLHTHLLVLSLFVVFGALVGRSLRQRRIAQDALRSSRHRYQQVFQGAAEAMWEVAPDCRILQANEAMTQLAGQPQHVLVGSLCHEILHTPLCHTDDCPLRVLSGGGHSGEREFVVGRADDRQALCVMRAQPVLDLDGGLEGVFESFENVTEQRKTEARFQALVDTTGDGITIINSDGVITYANDAFCEMLGYPAAQILGRTGSSFCDDENREILLGQLQRRLSGEEGEYEIQFLHRDGHPVHLLVTATALFDETGAYSGSFAVMKDISELKQAERRMSHLNSVLKAIRNVNQLITREQDRERLLAQACESLIETRGYAFACVFLYDASDRVTARFASGEVAYLAEVQDELLAGDLWARLNQHEQPEIHVCGPLAAGAGPALKAEAEAGRACMALRLDYSGHRYGMLVVSLPVALQDDADERSLFAEVTDDLAFALYAIQTEEARQESQAEVAAERDRSLRMLETAGALIVSLRPDGTATFFNRRCVEVTGYAPDQIVGRPVWEKLVPPEQVEPLQSVLRQVSRSEALTVFESTWLTRDGRERLISWRNTPVRDASGEVAEIVCIGLDITEHRAAETAVRESEARYRLLFNSGQDAIFVFELQPGGQPGRFLEANDVACEKFGYSREELLAMSPTDLDAPDEVEEVPDILTRLVEQEHVLFEQAHVARDGRVIPMEVNAHLFNFEGRPAVLSVARDISERKQAAEELAHLNSVLLAIRDVNQLITRKRDRVEILDGACRSLVETRGYHLAAIALLNEQEELVAQHSASQDGQPFSVSPEVARVCHRYAAEAASGDPTPVVLDPERFPDSERIQAEAEAGRTCLIMDLQYAGHRYGFLGISLDSRLSGSQEEQLLFKEVADDIAFALFALDAEAERERALASLELTQFSVDHAAISVFWIDRSARIIYANHAACASLGYGPDELTGMYVYELDPVFTKERWGPHWEETQPLGNCTFESVHRRRDGTEFPVEITINYLHYQGQDYQFSFVRDITGRKRSEQRLQRLNRQYELLVESQLVETFIIQQNRIVFANSTMHQKLGYELGRLIGRPAHEVFELREQGATLPWQLAGRSGDTAVSEVEMQITTCQGGSRWVQVWSQEIADFEGSPAIIGHMVDVTEARELRTQLEHSQRLEALGTLAGGVAHEFNNVLQAILLNASLLQLDRALSEQENDKLKTIIERTEYGARLTDQLLTFSRRAPVQYGALNLNDVIEETRRLLERTMPRQIRIRVDLADGLWAVNGDAGRLKQVLINLALNARDAMPGGGELTFRTQNVMLAKASLKGSQKLSPGPHVMIRVADTGCGMDDATLARAFEPFFTTKSVGQGTGLGLSIVHGIVDTHGGVIRMHSRRGSGTSFEILLPADPNRSAAPAAPVRHDAARGGHETILVVDDEPDVLRVAQEALGSFGYRVMTAANGQLAVQAYERAPEQVDLVLLDLIMPGLSGQQTLCKLRKVNPEVRVIVASGYIPASEQQPNLEGVCGYLEKPFSLERMLQMVRQTLDEARQ